MNMIDEIVGFPLFKGIQKEELHSMLGCLNGYLQSYKKEEYISFEEENVKSVGIVLQGAVRMIKEDIWGNTTFLVHIGVQQIFGETFACGSDSLSAVSFYASDDTQVLFLPFERVMLSCSNSCVFHHRLIENMVVLIADKNKILMEKLEIVSKKTLREKILAYLSLQAQHQNKRYFEVPLSRMELADYLCANRSALTRELSNMKEAGLLDYEKNVFHLL